MTGTTPRDRILAAIRASLDEQPWIDDVRVMRSLSVVVRLNEHGRPCDVDVRPELHVSI